RCRPPFRPMLAALALVNWPFRAISCLHFDTVRTRAYQTTNRRDRHRRARCCRSPEDPRTHALYQCGRLTFLSAPLRPPLAHRLPTGWRTASKRPFPRNSRGKHHTLPLFAAFHPPPTSREGTQAGGRRGLDRIFRRDLTFSAARDNAAS